MFELPDTGQISVSESQGGTEIIPAVTDITEEGEILPTSLQVVLHDLALAEVLGGQFATFLKQNMIG